MNKKLLPSDLRNISVKQRIKRMLLLALVAGVFTGIYCSLELNTPAEKTSIAALLLFLLGIVFAKVFPQITDNSFLGEVTDITIKTGVDMDWRFKRPWTQPRRNTIILDIRLINGKRISRQVYYERAEVYSKQEKLSPNIEKYRIGDKVFHLSGTAHTIVLPASSDFRVQCAVCGSYNNIQQDECSHCSHTLVKMPINFE